jgi:deoxyadenosine/deoxycytidine kinase
MYIAISGNIGSGKTTLAEKLGKYYNWEIEYEVVDTNPYLPDFYADMNSWSFHTQIFFLNTRFRQNQKIQKKGKNIIQDRTIYEDAYVFARNLNQNGFLADREYNTYLTLFTSMLEFIKPPDLLIYLKADIPKLVERIHNRGRVYENLIRIDYLRDLNSLYEDWTSQYRDSKLLTVNVNDLNFDKNPEDLSYIVNLIESEIHGLFS